MNKKDTACCPVTCNNLDMFFENYYDPHNWSWRCKKYKTLLSEKDYGDKVVKILRCKDCLAGKVVESKKIKPCPFCNGEGSLKHSQYAFWIVECIQCGARGSREESGEEAAENWNKRAL